MDENEVILGLLDRSAAIGSPRLAQKCRDLTITWSRYVYHGQIIEDASVDRILEAAAATGARFCLLLAWGEILRERWLLQAQESRARERFLVAGRVLEEASGWYGLDPRCLLVDLARYCELGRPAFEAAATDAVPLPGAVPRFEDGRLVALEPAPGGAPGRPTLPGWQLVAQSLRHGLAVVAVDRVLERPVLDLSPERAASATSFSRYLDGGLAQYVHGSAPGDLEPDQIAFLDDVSAQTQNARRGVFLFNIEPYTDVERPPGERWGPVSTLYSVAAGFKPNRILQTHGFDDDTRVVFFDYSPNALEVREHMLAQWDGTDFPGFVRRLFERFPHPQTFYQLWGSKTPDQVEWSDVVGLWEREVARFGGAREFARHWEAYRALRHEFVCCDILHEPDALMRRIVPEKHAVIWFSNAPFTVYSNWHHSLEQRRQLYDAFVGGLAARNPDLLLYGADYTNTSVNCLVAGEYWERYRRSGHDVLRPRPLHRHQISS